MEETENKGGSGIANFFRNGWNRFLRGPGGPTFKEPSLQGKITQFSEETQINENQPRQIQSNFEQCHAPSTGGEENPEFGPETLKENPVRDKQYLDTQETSPQNQNNDSFTNSTTDIFQMKEMQQSLEEDDDFLKIRLGCLRLDDHNQPNISKTQSSNNEISKQPLPQINTSTDNQQTVQHSKTKNRAPLVPPNSSPNSQIVVNQTVLEQLSVSALNQEDRMRIANIISLKTKQSIIKPDQNSEVQAQTIPNYQLEQTTSNHHQEDQEANKNQTTLAQNKSEPVFQHPMEATQDQEPNLGQIVLISTQIKTEIVAQSSMDVHQEGFHDPNLSQAKTEQSSMHHELNLHQSGIADQDPLLEVPNPNQTPKKIEDISHCPMELTKEQEQIVLENTQTKQEIVNQRPMDQINDEGKEELKSKTSSPVDQNPPKSEALILTNIEQPSEDDLEFIESTMEKLKFLHEDITEQGKDIERFTGTTTKDQEYLFLDEVLMRNLINLDNIETGNNEALRQERKNGIQLVQDMLRKLDAKLKENQRKGEKEVTVVVAPCKDLELDNNCQEVSENVKSEQEERKVERY